MLNNKIINILRSNRIVRPLYNHFTAGEDVKSLQTKIINMKQNNLLPIADYIKEYSNNENEIRDNAHEYLKLTDIKELKYIALKLSSFNYHFCSIENLVSIIVSRYKSILIDAEDVKNQDKINEITDFLMTKHNIHNVSIFKTYQMYRKDSLALLEKDLDKFPRLGVKLVRGAYMSLDKDSGLLFTNKDDTDNAFNKAIKLITKKTRDSYENKQIIKTFVCTHNQESINLLLKEINRFQKGQINKDYIYHASLYGFINNNTQKLINHGVKTFKYLPYGKLEDSVPYLLRRIEENPKILKYCLY